jgi:scavenger receptor class B protein 1
VGECHPSGVFNVSSCRLDSPTFLSLPHFYNADPYYIDAIEGISPQDKHEFYITLEPVSGQKYSDNFHFDDRETFGQKLQVL